MIDFLRLLAYALTRLFRSRARLEAEILVLRHQLNVLRRKAPERVAFSSIDRLVFAGLASSLVKYHHFGDEGLDVSDVRQTTTCSERAKVLVRVAHIIGLVIILRKEF